MEKKIIVNFEKNVKYPEIEEMLYPDKLYNELNIKFDKISKNNTIFRMVRNSFKMLEMDKENFETSNWNPLGENLIKPGNTVLIKPNLVLDRNLGNEGEDCLYTNPSLVAAVINYVWIALKGNGKIIVADAPVQNCNFEHLIETSGYQKMITFFQEKNVNIELRDLRGLITYLENGNNISKTFDKEGIIFDLAQNSEHFLVSEENIDKVRITNYNPDELLKHHNKEKHEYFIAKEVVEADVIINMPKPKAHRKAGVTIGLKNFVGVNIRKEYLPHHRFGSVKSGGDEYLNNSILLKIYSKLIDIINKFKYDKKFFVVKILSKIARIIQIIDKKFFSKEQYSEGSWYGNDTIWRTIVDINKIVRYGSKDGKLKDTPQRKIFSIADMIVVGEKEGPLLPSPKYGGIIAMGEDLVCFDEIVASILGFDINKVPLFKNIRNKRKYQLVNDEDYGIILSNDEKFNDKKINDINRKIALNIEPSSGWKGHIEMND